MPSGRRLLAGVLIAGAAAGMAQGLLNLHTDTSPESFLPAGDPALGSLQDAARSFGGDPIVVLARTSQPQQMFGAEQLPKLLALEGQLAKLPDTAVVYGPATVLNQIAQASQNLLATLAGRRDAVAAQAEQRAREERKPDKAVTAARDAAVAEFDARYGPLLVRGLPAGLPTLRNPGFVARVIFDQNGLPKPEWHFVVPDPRSVAILIRPREDLDQAGTERLTANVRSTVDGAGLTTERVTVTGIPAVTAALGSEVRWQAPLLGALAIVLIGVCYFAVPWIRPKRYRLLPLATSLAATAAVLALFGWLDHAVSLGVVAFLPVLVGIASDYQAYLAHPTGRRRVVVVGLAAATAFASLALSPLPFVRDLGLALAAGLLFSVGLALLVGRHLSHHARPSPLATVEEARPEGSRRPLSVGGRAGLLVLAAGIAAAGWVALPRLNVEAQPEKLASGLPALADIQIAEDVLGASGEVQVVLRGPDVLTPGALAWMRQVQDQLALRLGDRMRPVVSLPSLLEFLGPSPTQEQVTAGTDLLPDYLTGAVLRADHQRATMSFLLGLQDLRDQARLIGDARAAIPPPPPGYATDLVGLPVVAARGYQLVSADRYLTSAIGIAGAGIVLLIGLRRRSDALRAVLAAGLATGWGLAGIAALGLSLTPLTLALGSLTAATACEFTVMLCVRSARGSGVRTGRVVAAAALAAALGFAALSVSGLQIVREFGLILAATVGLSFAAAHLVVALSRKPDGRPEGGSPSAVPAREEVNA
ncbi:RND transporter family protein [Amycolatopsis acidiphila]|nr:RND transporter [Amycolatopsis acidiphila]